MGERDPRFVGAQLSRRRLMGGGLASVFLLSACDMPAMGAIGGGGTATVALLAPGGTGDAGLNALARDIENATRLAMTSLQGAQIDLRVYQVGADPARGAAQAQQAISDGAQIILGPLHAPVAQAVAPVAAAANVNVLSFSNNPSAASSHVFLLGPMFETTAVRILGFAAAQGRGRVMILSEQTEAGDVAVAAIERAAARTPATIVARQSYAFSQQGISEATPRITQAARSSGAQSLLMTAGSEGALPLLADLLPRNNLASSQVQYMGLTRWDVPSATLELEGLQGGWFALPDPGLSGQFQARYRAAYGANPAPPAALAYDGMAAIGALMQRGGRDRFSAQALSASEGFIGVNGIFRFRSDRTNERGLAVAEIRNRRVNILSPAPRSFAGGGS